MNKLIILLLILWKDDTFCRSQVAFPRGQISQIPYVELYNLKAGKLKYLEATKRPVVKEYHQEDTQSMILSYESGNINVAIDETPDTCEEQPYCYPKVGEVLLGRDSMISASSTCGLQGPERYCWPHTDDDCFYCDSRQYNYLYSHRAGKAIPHVEKTIAFDMYGFVTPNSDNSWVDAIRGAWWQSKNGDENVTMEIKFESKFAFVRFNVRFNYAFPHGMLVEMSSDFGKTWGKRVHMAHNCSDAFPNLPLVDFITHGMGKFTQGVRGEDFCFEKLRPLTVDGTHSYLDYTDPALNRRSMSLVHNPTPDLSPEIAEVTHVTNIRMKFTHFPAILQNSSLIHRPETSKFSFERQYYAAYEIVLMGRCLCNGHAERCVPPENSTFTETELKRMEVFSKCVCRHNTGGNSCEFCKPGFYLPEGRKITASRPCEPCNCDPNGTVNGTVCDNQTDPAKGMESGRCHCKRNVEGAKCDKCMDGYHNLNEENPDGCERVTRNSVEAAGSSE